VTKRRPQLRRVRLELDKTELCALLLAALAALRSRRLGASTLAELESARARVEVALVLAAKNGAIALRNQGKSANRHDRKAPKGPRRTRPPKAASRPKAIRRIDPGRRKSDD